MFVALVFLCNFLSGDEFGGNLPDWDNTEGWLDDAEWDAYWNDEDRKSKSINKELSLLLVEEDERMQYGFRPGSLAELLDDELDEGKIPTARKHIHTSWAGPDRIKNIRIAFDKAIFAANSLEIIFVTIENSRNDYNLAMIELMTKLITPRMKLFNLFLHIKNANSLSSSECKNMDAILSRAIHSKGLKHMTFAVTVCSHDDSLPKNPDFAAGLEADFLVSMVSAVLREVEFRIDVTELFTGSSHIKSILAPEDFSSFGSQCDPVSMG